MRFEAAAGLQELAKRSDLADPRSGSAAKETIGGAFKVCKLARRKGN